MAIYNLHFYTMHSTMTSRETCKINTKVWGYCTGHTYHLHSIFIFHCIYLHILKLKVSISVADNVQDEDY